MARYFEHSLPACQLTAAVFFLFAVASTCQADVVFHHVPGAIQPMENILFNDPNLVDEGLTVQGITNQTGLIANFTADESIFTPSHGQARIVALDGSLQELSFELDQGILFSELEFSARIRNRLEPEPNMTITVVDQNGNSHTSDPFALSNGNNFFSVETDDDLLLQQAILTIDAPGVRRVAHFRVTPVPEPTNILIVASFVVAMQPLMRRRRICLFN